MKEEKGKQKNQTSNSKCVWWGKKQERRWEDDGKELKNYCVGASREFVCFCFDVRLVLFDESSQEDQR